MAPQTISATGKESATILYTPKHFTRNKAAMVSGEARHAAFTLVEVLLVISLIMVITSLFAYNLPNLSKAFEQRTAEDLLREAIFEARAQAARTKSPVTLSWDSETQTLTLSAIEQSNNNNATAESLAERMNHLRDVPDLLEGEEDSGKTQGKSWTLSQSAGGETELNFYVRLSPQGVPGSYSEEYAKNKINQLRFVPTGASTPALVEILNERGERRYRIDPFNHDLTELK